MKLFRKLTVLALTLTLICTLGVSAFADDYFRTVSFDGGDMLIHTEIDQTEAYCDVGLDTDDVAGNYISIQIDGYFYETQADWDEGRMNNSGDYDVYTDISNDTFCYAWYQPPVIRYMHRAVYTCYAETGFGAYVSDYDVFTMYYI